MNFYGLIKLQYIGDDEIKQNLKNIMQVRNILHHKKQAYSKTNKNGNPEPHSKQRKRIKTAKTLKTQRSKSKSKSRSKSNNEKQNIKYRKSQSKSKQKVSPCKVRHIKGHNTSPIQPTDRNSKLKVSPIKIEDRDKYAKGVYSQRDYDLVCQTVSTKLNTQRTPVKKNIEKQVKAKQSTKKTKKSTKQLKNPRITVEIAKQSKKQKAPQLKTIKQIEQKKVKKCSPFVPPIKTQGPQRKQSYFDQQVIEKLNLDNAEFFRRKKNPFTSTATENNEQKKLNAPPPHFEKTAVSFRQYGTETIQPFPERPSLTYRDLQSLRKQQQLKWRIIYLELSQLKQGHSTQKIEQIIQESHRNISEFQTKCQEIVQFHNKDNYVFQSPTKIRHALTRRKKSEEESRSLIKTLSDQRLLQELESLDNFDQISQLRNSVKQEKPSSSSFCIQFQKQMQTYSQQNPVQNSTNPLINIQLQHIPQLQFDKSISICNQIQDRLCIQLCGQLAYSQKLLHSFLQFSNRNNETPSSDHQKQRQKQIQLLNQQMKIKCSQTYSIDLFYRLFKFIEDNGYTREILARINKPFGSAPLVNLKMLRNYFIENEEDLYEDEESIEVVIDSQLLNVFESENSEPIEGQYFYNHCVYSCFNQLLDTLRPFGLTGPPPLYSFSKPIHHNLSTIFSKTLSKLCQILEVKMGKSEFNEHELQFDPLKLAQKSYTLMDKFLILEQEQKWKKVQENILEEKYFLAQSIINDIFNEETMMIYNEFV